MTAHRPGSWCLMLIVLPFVLSPLAPCVAAAADATVRPGFRAVSLNDSGPAPWTSGWFADEMRVHLGVYVLTDELARTRFGVPWPAGRFSDSCCDDYDGPGSSPGFDNWFFRCTSNDRLGRTELYFYDLRGAGRPTLELRLRLIPAPPGSAPSPWRDVHRALAASVAKALRGALSWSSDSGMARIDSDSARVFVLLLADARTGAPESLEILHYSEALQRDSDAQREFGTAWFAEEDSLLKARRAEAARALRRVAPRLGEALARDSALVGDTAAVLEALRRSGRGGLGREERDLLRYGAHLWMADQPASGPAADSALGPSLAPTLGRYGVGLHFVDGGWYYGSELRDSLALRAGENRWTDAAFLDWLGDDTCDGPDQWRDVITRCERYLERWPRSAIAAEVLLHLGEAHETGWALSKMRSSGDRAFDPELYRLDAPAHRLRAIECYERYLGSSPTGRSAVDVRTRLLRLRLDVGTGITRYYCEEC